MMESKVSTKGALVRSAGILGSMTFLSRILGFIRDVLIARSFGTGLAAEAFVVSFKVPNLFRDMVGEGAMNSAIVPVLSETRSRWGEDEFRRLSWTLFYWFLLILVALSIVGSLFAPLVVRIAAPGFSQDAEKFALTIDLTRIIFPFIFLAGMSALMMGVLNTMRAFGSSAVGPILLNLSMILALIFMVPYWGVKALVLGVLAGGCLQCGVQILSLLRKSFYAMKTKLLDPAVKKIFRLLVPRILGTAVYQVSVFVDTILASFYWIVGLGGQSALYYSSRLFQLPLALFGVSFAQAALPALSSHYAKNEMELFKEATLFSLRQIIFTTVPAAVGLALFSESIVAVLFKRGEFTDYSAYVTSNALFFYSFGLLSCAAIKVLANAFYALQDTRTPVKTAFVSFLMNLVLSIALMWKLKIGGLALATSLSATVHAVFLYVLLARKVGTFHHGELRGVSLRSAGAGAVMGVLGWWFFLPWVRDGISHEGLGISAFRLTVSIVFSVMIYYFLSYLWGSSEARGIKRFFAKAGM